MIGMTILMRNLNRNGNESQLNFTLLSGNNLDQSFKKKLYEAIAEQKEDHIGEGEDQNLALNPK